MDPEARELLEVLASQKAIISEERQGQLEQLAHLVRQSLDQRGYAALLFVCTHNSRRSQLAEVMLSVCAPHFGLTTIGSYSAGTASTAFNQRMVEAIGSYGISLEKLSEGDNPRYRLSSIYGKSNDLFSKTLDDPANPSSHFIAVMVCSDAEEACPFVPGADHRFSLQYLDPKAFDDTPKESSAYRDKVLEIGREMYQLCSLLKD